MITPAVCPLEGGRVVITGLNFATGLTLRIAGKITQYGLSEDRCKLSCITPPLKKPEMVLVECINPNGQRCEMEALQYMEFPAAST